MRAIYAILVAYLLLASCYAYATPPFESPDELYHAGFMDYVASTGWIPQQVVGVKTRYEQEGSQPPLYYLITGALAAGIDRSDFDRVTQINPHAIIGDPSAEGNKNMVLHDDPYPPRLSGTVLALFMGRVFSILCGAVTVCAVYQCGRVLAPDRPSVALLAAGLTAFNPQFLFISASLNNDNLVTALNSLIIWQLLLMLRDGLKDQRSLLIALLIPLATLSKLSGLILVPVVALAGLFLAYRRRQYRELFILGGLMAGLWAGIAGWWYLRNLLLYDDFTGMQRMLDIFGRRPAPPLPDLIFSESEGLRMSYWGIFGWFNVFTVQAFYRVMDVVALLGLVGLTLGAFTMRRDRLVKIVFLALIAALALISLISWTSQTAASQGRLLFPFIAAISCLLAYGLARLRIPALLVTPLAAFALVVPFVTILPAYAPPAPLEELPPTATPIYAQWRDMALVGYEVQPRRYMPGDAVPITLYWQPVQAADADYSLFIRLLNPNNDIIARLPTYPGYGRMRTSTWKPGGIYPDSYTVHIPEGINGQFGLRAYVGWWKFPEGTPLDPVDQSGTPEAQVIFSVGGFVSPSDSAPEIEQRIAPVDFGGTVSLVAYALQGDLLTLLWESTGELGEDLTVFAQVVDANGEIVGQGDAPPVLPTRFWQPGERYMTAHPLVYPQPPDAGTYTVLVGWYSTAYPMRLAAAYPDNAFPLTTITVAAG